MADPSETLFWIACLAFAVLGGGWFAFRWLHIARLIEDTATSRVRSASQGYVELEGRAGLLPGPGSFGPLTRRECAWWHYRVQHRNESADEGGRRERWRTVASGRSDLPFTVDDGTGSCIVNPAGALVLAAESTTWYGSTPWPTGMPGQPGRGIGSGRDYRYFEERIHEHELVYALGGFRTVSGADTVATDEAVRALLAEWKQDQVELERRFDQDGDGSISLEEWEEARAVARRNVEQQRTERPAVSARHVLGRPADGQLYLLATFRAADVARRFRRRALLAFAGFVAAVCALGWLVQGLLLRA